MCLDLDFFNLLDCIFAKFHRDLGKNMTRQMENRTLLRGLQMWIKTLTPICVDVVL